jgi:hypothetical protein
MHRFACFLKKKFPGVTSPFPLEEFRGGEGSKRKDRKGRIRETMV